MTHQQCRKCGHIRTPQDTGPDYACPKCQGVYAKVNALFQVIDRARETGDWSTVPEPIRLQLLERITLCTLETVPGRTIANVVNVVSADYAFAFGGIFETFAGLGRDIVGSGNSGMTTDFLIGGRTACNNAVRQTALKLNADAVIGLRYHFHEISGANQRGVLVISATGTAVKLHT